jgi:hypothetical protein
MKTRGMVLASIQGLGSVYDCGNCGNIHLQIGAVNITLMLEDYMHLVAMISTSAANLEPWLEHWNNGPMQQSKRKGNTELEEEI